MLENRVLIGVKAVATQQHPKAMQAIGTQRLLDENIRTALIRLPQTE